MRLIITGGHHSSALPVIKILNVMYKDIEIFWIGHRHTLLGDKNDTMEYIEITKLGIPFFKLNAGKVYRNYNLKRILLVPWGFLQALFLVARIRPNLVLSFGGYIAAPVVFAAKLFGVPSLTHEQTVTAGYANSFIAKFADKILISWKDTMHHFPREKTVFVGLPLRESVFKVSTSSFNADNNLPYVYITGGKTGSVKINKVILDSLSELLTFSNVILQCGNYSENDYFSRLQQQYDSIKNKVPGEFYLRRFVLDDEIGEAYAKASLVVGRAGAHTVSELLYLRKPALLIPISWVSHNEQYKNATILKLNGSAEILDENKLNGSLLISQINNMLVNIQEYKRKAEEVNLEKPFGDAAQLIVNEILNYQKKI